MTVEKRINEVVNRLNKTKTERFPDLRVEKEQRDQEEREDKRKEMNEKVKPKPALAYFFPAKNCSHSSRPTF